MLMIVRNHMLSLLSQVLRLLPQRPPSCNLLLARRGHNQKNFHKRGWRVSRSVGSSLLCIPRQGCSCGRLLAYVVVCNKRRMNRERHAEMSMRYIKAKLRVAVTIFLVSLKYVFSISVSAMLPLLTCPADHRSI
ncbi:hypothetical protein IQ06DRAFT_49548 [Phaeosphaeriaceae sp. SRC1lsM3a]|nr:hypothetical protein IQ06DRAFT_49548 [Stagonospora sp. SRC1lsM3a]